MTIHKTTFSTIRFLCRSSTHHYLRHSSIVPCTNYILPSNNPSSSYHFSSSDSSTTEKIDPSKIFPWRHSTTLLHRLVDQNDLSGQPNNYRGRLIRSLLVSRELNTPFYKVFLGVWKDELARDCVEAWRMGVLGVLTKSFGVPMEEMDNPNDDENIQTISINTTNNQSNTPKPTQQQQDVNNFLSSILDSKLQNLYSTLPSSQNIQINFMMQPISYKLQHAFLVPMFTRTHVQQNPNLLGAYTKIEMEFQKTGSPQVVQQMTNDIIDNQMKGETGFRSIIIDVAVDCLEVFSLVDGTTGEVLRGDGKEREVTHLVRFEMETSSGGSKKGERVLGQWKIIDWDDLLEGNVWH